MNHCKRREQYVMSKSGSVSNPEISSKVTYLLIEWHSAYRWHDLNLGSSMERGNLMYDAKRKPYKAETEGGKY